MILNTDKLITSVLKVLAFIITSIITRPLGLVVMLVIMSVSAFKSDVILYLLRKDYGKGVHYTSILYIVNYNNILEIYVFKQLTEMGWGVLFGIICLFFQCVLKVSILPLSTIFLLDLGTVPTVWYFFFPYYFYISIHSSIKSQN